MQEIYTNYGGGLETPKDPRDYKVSLDKAAGDLPPNEHYIDFEDWTILNQRKVGICVAACAVQQAQNHYGIEFSADFNYLMQKIEEGNWNEGCWIGTAPKVAKKYGFLPLAEFPRITEQNPGINYDEYIAILRAIPQEKINAWIEIAKQYRIAGYAGVENIDQVGIANALLKTKTGLLTRYVVTPTWYTSIDGIITWAYDKISPLRAGRYLSGHCISITGYNLEKNSERLTNTWGLGWGDKGKAFTSPQVKPTEAWILYWDKVPDTVIKDRFDYIFVRDLKRGEKSKEVLYLQTILKILGFFGEVPTGYYGVKTTDAVKRYQIAKGMKGTTGRITGVNTRKLINQDIINYNSR